MATSPPIKPTVPVTPPPANAVAPTEGEVDTRASEGDGVAPIGSISDAVHTEGTNTPKPHEEVKLVERKDQVDQPVTSLATLHAWHQKRGTQPTHDEVEAVKKLENDIATEGAKHHRGPSATVDKPQAKK